MDIRTRIVLAIAALWIDTGRMSRGERIGWAVYISGILVLWLFTAHYAHQNWHH